MIDNQEKDKVKKKSFFAKAKDWTSKHLNLSNPMISTGFLCIGLGATESAIGSTTYNVIAASTVILSAHDLVNFGIGFYQIFKEFNQLRTGEKKIEEGKKRRYVFDKVCELGVLTLISAFTVLYMAFIFTSPAIKELGLAATAILAAVRSFSIIKGTFDKDAGDLLLTKKIDEHGKVTYEKEPKIEPEITQDKGKWNNKPLKAYNLFTAAVGLTAVGLSIAAFVTAAPVIGLVGSVIVQAYNLATIGKSCIVPLIKEIKEFRAGKEPENMPKYIRSKILDAGLVLVGLAGLAVTIAAAVAGGPLGLMIASAVTTAVTQTLLFVKEGNTHYTSNFFIKTGGNKTEKMRSTSLEQEVGRDFPMATKFVEKEKKKPENHVDSVTQSRQDIEGPNKSK